MKILDRLLKSRVKAYLESLDSSQAWTRIFDWTPGAWQTHHPYSSQDSVLSYPTVFSCITLIESDIGKLRPIVQRNVGGIWEEAQHRVSDLLRNPNSYQNHIQFKQHWLNSKLVHGNTYALKLRSGQVVEELHILDPFAVTPLISPGGQVFYRIGKDNLAGLEESDTVVPASEIIHDRFNCLYHPLVGLSPIYAAGTSAQTGLSVQKDARYFFENGAKPSGVLTAPGSISESTANRIKEYWRTNFSGKKSGNIAIFGDGLKYEAMRMSNVDAQMIEILGWNDYKICSVFHVPAYKVGVGDMPTYNNIEALTQQYYSQCLQILIESMETSLDVGLGMEANMRMQIDLDGLFRMDTATQIDTLSKSVGAAIHSPDEARRKLNLPKVPGGQYPYLQQQNYSLEALAARDATNPLAAPEPAQPPDPADPADPNEPAEPDEPNSDDSQDMAGAMAMLDALIKASPIQYRTIQ